VSEARKDSVAGATVIHRPSGSSEPLDHQTGVPMSAPRVASGAVGIELVGTVLSDRYRVLKKLGEGGMGSVYLAEHTTINKKLAIKVLSPEYSHKQDLVDRFLQEARAASMIDQENVVEITDFGATPGGSVYFVMEYLNGEDLAATIKRDGAISWSRAKPIMLQICDALAAAHDAGIIHRDMKPENCFRIRRGSNEDFVKVLDFGIAKVTSDEEGGSGRNLTRTGMIFGTPEYMSPEQAKGEKVDHRVDIYALGVILYELLTGKVPFSSDTFMGVLTKHMFEAPPAPRVANPVVEIPDEVEAIILKALQKDREYRFQSLREMATAIRAVGTGAAAVKVVREEVFAPSSGRMRFGSVNGGTQIRSSNELKLPSRFEDGSRLWRIALITSLTFAVLAGGSMTAYGLGLFGGNEPRSAAVVAVVEDPSSDVVKDVVVTKADPRPEIPEPDESSEAGARAEPKAPVVVPPNPTAGLERVMITIETPGIDGEVRDNRDDAKLGPTNQPIAIPFSSDAFGLYVSADGYEAQILDVVPDNDKTLTASLTKLAPKEPRRNRSSGTRPRTRTETGSSEGGTTPTEATGSTDPTSKPKVTPVSNDPKPNDAKPNVANPGTKRVTPKPPSGSPDLKNPFGN